MTEPDWRRIEELFHEVAALPPEERAARLDAACAGEPALRREVEGLLRSHASAGEFLETPVRSEAVEEVLRAAWPPLLGEACGPYRLLRELGRGGMGEVYLAERADEEFRQRVAVKLIRPGVLDDRAIERFHRERQILADLDHPGITRLLDGGTTPEGRPYLVMELVDGVPIDRYCAERDLSVTDRVRLFLEVCAAVEHAHRCLVVHRDLKHGNILVTKEGVPKLLDFGIARVLDREPASGEAEAATVEGAMTPDYASPEQARGGAITTSTDVYSLGVLLYRLLAGVPPYVLAGVDPLERVRSICEAEPRRPSDAVRAAAGGEAERRSRRLHGDLDAIVLKALRKEPARRYASVEQLAADLRRHLAGEPVRARRGTLGYLAGRFVRRHGLAVGAALLFVAMLVAGILLTAHHARVAEAERDEARRQMRRAERVAEFVQRMLGSPDPYAQGRLLTVPEVLDEASRHAGEELAGEPEVEAAVRATLARTYLDLGRYDAAEQELRRALELRTALLGDDHPEVGELLQNLSVVLADRGDLAGAEPLCRRALAITRGGAGGDGRSVAAVLDALGGLLLRQGDLAGAEAAQEEALALRRRLFGPVHADVAESLNDLSVVLGTKGDLERAETLQQEALSVIRELRGPEHPEVAAALSNLAAVQESRGELAAAEATYREALAMRRRLLGDRHPDLAWTLVGFAHFLGERGAVEEAEALADEVLALRGDVLPDEHPTVAAALLVRGRCLLERDELDAAREGFEECLALRGRTLPEGHWLLANTRSVLGECLARLGRRDEAEPLLRESAARLEELFGAEDERAGDAAGRLRRWGGDGR